MVITLELVHWNITYGVGRNIREIPKPSTNKTSNEIYKHWGVNEWYPWGEKDFKKKYE